MDRSTKQGRDQKPVTDFREWVYVSRVISSSCAGFGSQLSSMQKIPLHELEDVLTPRVYHLSKRFLNENSRGLEGFQAQSSLMAWRWAAAISQSLEALVSKIGNSRCFSPQAEAAWVAGGYER
jgi:hypothetical protein